MDYVDNILSRTKIQTGTEFETKLMKVKRNKMPIPDICCGFLQETTVMPCLVILVMGAKPEVKGWNQEVQLNMVDKRALVDLWIRARYIAKYGWKRK